MCHQELRRLLTILSIFLSTSCGDGRQPTWSDAQLIDIETGGSSVSPPIKKDSGFAQDDSGSEIDSYAPTCGFCTGSNCCCSGLNSECDPGFICVIDGFCDPAYGLSYTLEITDLEVNAKDDSGLPWDPDGPPDLQVVVSIDTQEVSRSTVVKDTLKLVNIYMQAPCGPIDSNTSLTIQVFDVDGAGTETSETLIGDLSWSKVPLDVLTSDYGVEVMPQPPKATAGLQHLVIHFQWGYP